MFPDGGEERYLRALEQLTSYFVSHCCMTTSDKTKAVSQYRALLAKFHLSQTDRTSYWFSFLSCQYELHRRPELRQMFKYVCLCLPPQAKIPV